MYTIVLTFAHTNVNTFEHTVYCLTFVITNVKAFVRTIVI